MDNQPIVGAYNPTQNSRPVKPTVAPSFGMGVSALTDGDSEDQVPASSPEDTLSGIRKRLGLSPVNYSGTIGVTRSDYSNLIQTTDRFRKNKNAVREAALALHDQINSFLR